ncbi:hypothetical protein ACFQV2_05000 [Actinokineospora soli]|uniref:Uncharacterized protein n=1 Tax=Actinokineospora soli TaxID=1048753 RepID=A0ABW2TJ46_9PSEU
MCRAGWSAAPLNAAVWSRYPTALTSTVSLPAGMGPQVVCANRYRPRSSVCVSPTCPSHSLCR